uniref:Uncharacterized protein n=1 Tax=Anguilla anguilla TaxID=7936 RepID=A0A0E9Q6K7_ANGAN
MEPATSNKSPGPPHLLLSSHLDESGVKSRGGKSTGSESKSPPQHFVPVTSVC